MNYQKISKLKRNLKIFGTLVVLAWLGWILAGCAILPGVAAFTASPTAGVRPLTVQFTDQSTGTPTSWLWDFGDGTKSTERNPTHKYTTAGIYTVSLTVSYGGLGTSTETKHDYIKVGDAGVGVPGGQATLGAAIAAAPPGGIVLVGAGTYHENIEINKAGLRLLAASRPVIDGNVTFDAPNILIQGFEITGKLITTANAKDETVRNCRVYGKEFTELLFDTVVNAGDSIQAAINAATAGDVIFVSPGTYSESLAITKSLTLLGASSTNTIIQGTGSPIVVISSGNVNIQGFQIKTSLNAIDLNGIKLAQLSTVSNVTIANNWIRNLNTTATYAIGIWVQSQNSNITLSDNRIENITSGGLAYGILLSEASGMGNNNVLVRGNQVSSIQGAVGVGIGISVNDDFHNVTVEGNTVSNLSSPAANVRVIGIASGGTAGTPSNVTIRNNTVSNIAWTDTNIQDAVGIGVGDTAKDVTIQNNTVENCGVGIGLATSGPNIQIIGGNDILNNQVGIGIGTPPQTGWKANQNNITGNVVFGVQNTTGTVFDAENNWWGDASGPNDPNGTNEVPPCTTDPTTEKNSDGMGDKVSDNVDYCPWATTAF